MSINTSYAAVTSSCSQNNKNKQNSSFSTFRSIAQRNIDNITLYQKNIKSAKEKFEAERIIHHHIAKRIKEERDINFNFKNQLNDRENVRYKAEIERIDEELCNEINQINDERSFNGSLSFPSTLS